MGEIERSECRVYRKRKNSVSARHLVGRQAVSLAPEKHRAPVAAADAVVQRRRGLIRTQDRKGHLAPPGGRGDDVDAVADRGVERLKNLGAVNDGRRARRHRRSLGVWPTVAGIDQPQAGDAEVQHRPRCGADIFPHLRLDKDKYRRRSRQFARP